MCIKKKWMGQIMDIGSNGLVLNLIGKIRSVSTNYQVLYLFFNSLAG